MNRKMRNYIVEKYKFTCLHATTSAAKKKRPDLALGTFSWNLVITNCYAMLSLWANWLQLNSQLK